MCFSRVCERNCPQVLELSTIHRTGSVFFNISGYDETLALPLGRGGGGGEVFCPQSRSSRLVLLKIPGEFQTFEKLSKIIWVPIGY